MSHAIEVQGLTYRAGPDFVLDRLDLAVPTGSIYGFSRAKRIGQDHYDQVIAGSTARERGFDPASG